MKNAYRKNAYRKNAFLAMVGLVALMVSLMVFAYSHAYADTATGTCDGQSGYSHCVLFDKNWTFNSSVKFDGICCIQVDYNLKGHIGYNTSFNPPLGTTTYTKITILQPVLTAHTFLCGNSCLQDPVTFLGMTQYWDGYACDFNPSFGLSGPWGITLSFWPSCGNRNVARRYQGFSTTSSSYTQFNTGDPVKIGDWSTPQLSPNATPCYGINISSTIAEGSLGDQFASTSTREVCLPQ